MNTIRVFLFTALLGVPGCSHQIMEAQLVSMTKPNLPASAKPKSKGDVSGKFCVGDPAQKAAGGIIGLMDEAVIRAQTKHKCDYIRHARFIQHDGFFKHCMEVVGEGLAL